MRILEDSDGGEMPQNYGVMKNGSRQVRRRVSSLPSVQASGLGHLVSS